MKRFSIGLAALALGVSVGSYAAGVEPPPPPTGHFVIGANIFFPQPSDTQLHYGTVSDVDFSNIGDSINNHMLFVKPSYHVGWSVHAGYIFNPYDYIMGEYNYFSDTNNDRTHVGGNQFIIPVIENAASLLSGTIYQTARGSVKHRYQSASIVLGHMWGSGGGLMFSVFGGGKWAELKRDFDAEFSDGTAPDNAIFPPVFHPANNSFIWEQSDVSAFGPVVGWWGHYLFKGTEMDNVPGTGFGLMAKMSLAFLMGSVDTHQLASIATGVAAGGGPNPNIAIHATADSGTRIIPNLNAKIGATYTFPLSGMGMVGPMKLVLGVGWKVNYYFDAYSRIPLGVATFSHNIGFQGPYADITAII